MPSFQSRAPVARTCPQRYTSPSPRDVTQIAGFYAPTPTHSPLSKLNKTDLSRRWPPCRSGLAWTKRDGVLRITMITVRSSPRRSLQPSLRLIDSPGTIYCACVLIFLWHPLLPYWYSYKHPVPDRVKPSFVIFLTSGHSDDQPWTSECPDVKNYKWRLNPVLHRMLYSCTHILWQQWVSKWL